MNLGAFQFHLRPQSEFIAQANAAIDRADWLMQLDPYRMFSMFANIGGARAGCSIMKQPPDSASTTW